MNSLISSFFMAILALSLVACGPVPGSSLSGDAQSAPDDWQDVMEDRSLCEIESRPSEPHSIQLECFLYEDGLHVQSHRWVDASWWPTTSWATIWQEHPNVVVRIGGNLYRLTANVVKKERDEILTLRGYDPIPNGIVVFRFERPVP